MCAHEHARVGEQSIVGELLLSWQGWLLIGTPREWYECRCHSENATDGPTLIHSYGELLSPEGLQIIKAFTTLNTHTSLSPASSACMFVCGHHLYVCIYVPVKYILVVCIDILARLLAL